MGAHILLVEDEPQVARTITAMLERDGFTVHHVDQAGSITDALENHTFDLVVSDIHLPDDHELGFLDRLARQAGVRLPVILITGAATVETAVQALRHGVVDYLQKPIHREALTESIVKALKWRDAMQTVEQAQRDAEGWLRSLRSTSRLLQMGGARRGDASESAAAEHGSLLIGRLSQRERDIVGKLSSGQRVAEIAVTLQISPNTVRNHLKSVFRKLGVSSQVELLAKLSSNH